jgi:hypothetical protein
MKYKIVKTDTYNGLLRCINKALENNHELRKVCQCRECRHRVNVYKNLKIDDVTVFCYGEKSNNYLKEMDYYGSCEKCERR